MTNVKLTTTTFQPLQWEESLCPGVSTSTSETSGYI